MGMGWGGGRRKEKNRQRKKKCLLSSSCLPMSQGSQVQSAVISVLAIGQRDSLMA